MPYVCLMALLVYEVSWYQGEIFHWLAVKLFSLSSTIQLIQDKIAQRVSLTLDTYFSVDVYILDSHLLSCCHANCLFDYNCF